MRAALAARADAEFYVCAETEPRAWAESADADVVLWDFSPEHADLLADAVEGDHRVLALTDDARAAATALRRGARAVLSRDTSAPRLRIAADAVREGLLVLEPEAGTRLVGEDAGLSVTLTERELEVVELLAEGLSNRAIATELGISEHTAKFHVASVLDKLDATTRTEAVVRAARSGLLSL